MLKQKENLKCCLLDWNFVFNMELVFHLALSFSFSPSFWPPTSFWFYSVHFKSVVFCLCQSRILSFLLSNSCLWEVSFPPSPSISVYLLKIFMKLWKPSSPKKSKEPCVVPRWTNSSTRRTTSSRGTSRFQPAARILYHLALSEHSWAACRFPMVFWSLAFIE